LLLKPEQVFIDKFDLTIFICSCTAKIDNLFLDKEPCSFQLFSKKNLTSVNTVCLLRTHVRAAIKSQILLQNLLLKCGMEDSSTVFILFEAAFTKIAESSHCLRTQIAPVILVTSQSRHPREVVDGFVYIVYVLK
jgi:hypothetical protein